MVITYSMVLYHTRLIFIVSRNMFFMVFSDNLKVLFTKLS